MALAKYQEIADRLRDQIDSGMFQPGERLPSEPDLVRQFDASRNTVRLALALLTNQGLVVTRQGLGTFVTEPTKPFTALLSRVSEQPHGQSSSTILPQVGNTAGEPETSRQVVEKAPASPSVAEKLEIAPGELIVVRRRQGSIGAVPWMMMASYFPLDVAEGTPLEQAGEIINGSIALLAEMGYPQVGFVDEIGARMPSAREFAFFGLSTGTPVLVVNRTAYTPDRPIRLTRYIYRGDRVRLTHEVGTIPARYRSG
ncbi:MAG TPA: GntR family transcriptional regulator [Streptosporangiaceae bacterium]|nr:GntR family transcriptional regulator [Streptosporangiaceae bacterium]